MRANSTPSKEPIMTMPDSSPEIHRKLPGHRGFRQNAHWMLIVLYFLVQFPSLFSPVIYHGDERFYTDGAVRMIQTGDYLTPYYSSGALRFRKPIATYWVIAASYKIFGISLFASRIPFLLAGCLVIWFTHKTSLALLKREQEALLAATLFFSNEQFFVISTRSTPDILQTLFLSVSLYGFANILFNRSKARLDYGCAYLGAALTVATKGLLGMVPVVYAFAFSVIAPKELTRPRNLIDLPVMASAAVVALFWYALILAEHGGFAIGGFLGDQVTERLDGSKVYILKNAMEYLIAVLRHFFPWSLLLVLAFLQKAGSIIDFIKENRYVCLFTGAWFATLYGIFILGNLTRSRYLLPAYPLLAVLFAALLIKATEYAKCSQLIRKVENTLVLSGLAAAVLIALAGARVDFRWSAGGSLLFVFTLVPYLLLFKHSNMGGFAVTGVFLVLLYATFFTFLKPVFSVSPVTSLAQCLAPVSMSKPVRVASIGLPHEYQHQLTLFSDGAVWVAELLDLPGKRQLEQYPALIVSENYREELIGYGYQVQQCGYEYRRWHLKDMLALLNSSQKRQRIASMKEFYYVALPRERPGLLPSH